MIFIHSGIHFKAFLPWIATALMLIVTGSGHVGQCLLKKVRDEVKMKMKQRGVELTDDDLNRQQFWDTLTVKTLEKWRTIHMPMVSVITAFTTIHILWMMIACMTTYFSFSLKWVGEVKKSLCMKPRQARSR